jgi:hypothetical protein
MATLYVPVTRCCNSVIHLLRHEDTMKRLEVIMKTLSSSRGVRGLTSDELLGLPAAIDLDTANCALMIGRSTGYALAKQGRYPVKVLRLGNAYRVVTADLLKLLGLERPPFDARHSDAKQHGLCA